MGVQEIPKILGIGNAGRFGRGPFGGRLTRREFGDVVENDVAFGTWLSIDDRVGDGVSAVNARILFPPYDVGVR
jgi:hypothetical protein